MSSSSSPAPRGILVVDKPRGPTSHDVAMWARRALGTKAIGHAGTLDPMASGVLVLAVGEGTKLVPYLVLDDKQYRFDLTLGTETDTLDAEGQGIETLPVPPLDVEGVREVLARFVGPQQQVPPAYSAIKVGGEALHKRARRGEEVDVPPRSVEVHALSLIAMEGARLTMDVHASKGFYVRSLGRDLARALGTVGHLTALRRVASGAFRLEDAVDGELLSAARKDDEARARVRTALRPLETSLGAIPCVALDEAAVRDARAGRPVRVDTDVSLGKAAALLDPSGRLVAMAERRDTYFQVLRGILPVDA